MREKAEKDYMIWTEKSRKSTNYSLALAQVIDDIIKNGHTFSREKWEAIYKSKETPWRSNKILQEVMVKTKGFPDDMCEKILSCAFNKKIYKAALSREDISAKNIGIALAGISERTLNQSINDNELSIATINQLAIKLINRLTYDNDFIPSKHELKILEQTTEDFAIKNYLSEFEFGEINETVSSAFINNKNLSEETRNFAFDLGCDPALITIPYTEHMKEINIDGVLESYFDSPSIYTSFLVNSIKQHLINENTELEILNAFNSKKTSSKSFRKDEVLSTLFALTKNENVAKTGLSMFPDFAKEVMFFNENINYDVVKPYVNDQLVSFLNTPLSTGVAIRNFEMARYSFTKKMEGPWKDICFDNTVYDQIKTIFEATIKTPKFQVLLPFIVSEKMPLDTLKKIIEMPSCVLLDTSQQSHFNSCKAIAIQSLILRDANLSFDVSGVNLSVYLRQMAEAAAGSYIAKGGLSSTTKLLVSTPEFIENGDKYIDAFKDTLEILQDKYTPSNYHFQNEGLNDIIRQFKDTIDDLTTELSTQRALHKMPAECNREEIAIAKNHCLTTANVNATEDPVSFITNFENKKSYFIDLCQREYEIDIEEGKIKPTSLIEEVFEGGKPLFAKPSAPVVYSPIGIKIDEIGEI